MASCFLSYSLWKESGSSFRAASAHLLEQHRPASAAGRSGAGGLGGLVGQAAAGLLAGRVVVVPVVGLHEVHEAVALHALESGLEQAEVADDGGGDEEHHKEDEEGEVEDGVADDAALAQLGLLEGVDRRADLAAVELLVSAAFWRIME